MGGERRWTARRRLDGYGRQWTVRQRLESNGLTAMGSDLTVMDGAAGRQWTVRWDVNGRRDGSLMAMDGVAAPRRR